MTCCKCGKVITDVEISLSKSAGLNNVYCRSCLSIGIRRLLAAMIDRVKKIEDGTFEQSDRLEQDVPLLNMEGGE